MRKILLMAAMVAFLGGCASDVKKEAPVEDGRLTPSTAVTPPQTEIKKIDVTGVTETSDTALKKGDLAKRSIFYDLDKYDVKDEYKPMLQAHAKYLSTHGKARMLIQGNCDDRGSREYNIALGQKRSDGIRKMLMLMGAQEAQIESVSLGKEKPRCTEQDESCYAQNRRGDMLYGGE
jgi:peptidoglycan-associated lipoprotein